MEWTSKPAYTEDGAMLDCIPISPSRIVIDSMGKRGKKWRFVFSMTPEEARKLAIALNHAADCATGIETMGYKLIQVVGQVEFITATTFPTSAGAIEYGNEWLGEEEYTVQCEIEAGNPEAAEYPTYFCVEDCAGNEVYRSNRVAP